MKKPTILAVDDTPGNLVALEAVLDRDFELTFASCGAKAIEAVQARSDIAVILMDVQMPDMDGFEAARRIKLLPAGREIPIVFITAVFSEDPYVKRGYEVGGVDYFTKPFDPDLLRLKTTIYASFRQRSLLLDERERHLRDTEELARAGAKLTAVLDTLPIGVLIADLDGRICQSNEEMARICKATEAIEHDAYGELLGWWWTGGRDIKDLNGPVGGVLRGGAAERNARLGIRCFDGTEKTIAASVSPLLGLGGKIAGAVIVIRDTSQTTQIEAELEDRVARLISANIEIQQSVGARRD